GQEGDGRRARIAPRSAILDARRLEDRSSTDREATMPRCLKLTLLLLAFATPALPAESISYKMPVTPLLSTSETVIGQPIVFPAGTAKVTAAIITLPPGGETGWHSHPVPLFGYMLEGELTVDYGDKGVKVYKPGDSLMEAVNWP